MLYRKKPTIIEAVQWTGENYRMIKEFAGEDFICWWMNSGNIAIQADEGEKNIKKGDWLIRGNDQKLHSCSEDTFKERYEPLPGGDKYIICPSCKEMGIPSLWQANMCIACANKDRGFIS